jgi:hypothetical protein
LNFSILQDCSVGRGCVLDPLVRMMYCGRRMLG